MKQIVESMHRLCQAGQDFALATVIDRSGSVPRSVGAKMLVAGDGSSVGTVGGGIIEARVKTRALQVIKERNAAVETYQFSGVEAAEMEAICGGELKILVEWVGASSAHTAQLTAALRAVLQLHQRAWWVTVVPGPSAQTRHALVQPDGTVTGSLPADLPIERIIGAHSALMMDLPAHQVLVEPLNHTGTVFIFGAGHVSQSLAVFTHAVGFWTVVLDDRREYANRARFPDADEIIVLDSSDQALTNLLVNGESFIVIVTRGHLDDLTVLAQALRTPAGYIGMIGSKRKCALIFDALSNMGFNEEHIQRVHAPIGLAIGAQTPAEIGISITAQLIQERARLIK